jgi:predicted amidohydrolase
VHRIRTVRGLVAEAGSGEETLLVDVDPGNVAETRSRLPFLSDR